MTNVKMWHGDDLLAVAFRGARGSAVGMGPPMIADGWVDFAAERRGARSGAKAERERREWEGNTRRVSPQRPWARVEQDLGSAARTRA